MQIILIDDREPKKSIARYRRRLAELGDYKTAVVRLNEGDFVVPPHLAVERKDVNDLLGSIADGRLFSQVERMTAKYKVPVLLVEGNLTQRNGKVVADRRNTGWDWWSVQAALWKIQSMGCLVVRSSHGKAAETLHHLIQWANNAEVQKVAGLHFEKTLNDDGLKVLMSIPFVGAKTAVKLVEYAGSPAWALVALTELDRRVKVPGVSRRQRLETRRVLGLRDNERLLVVSLEDTTEANDG